ncbi:hypothetical protein LAZ67_6003739 [Cordylochernes scorpioides]|uniref:Reverse transcriptase domain-containing protein n=1 Tax=Cordylochernes scorpioides TaxID=51811 RepID=A0ABY6KNT2_9ARAC|nr:hypothetical protein LAZ67_6003739 [Cordylochernes scorpioides]
MSRCGFVVAYADDIVLFIRDDAQFELVTLIFEEFRMSSGVAVNFTKSCGLWCGSWKHRTDSPLGISWTSESLTVLGCTITTRYTVASQASHLMGLLEQAIARWTPFTRGLSLVGRSRAANSLVLGSIMHHLHGYFPPEPPSSGCRRVSCRVRAEFLRPPDQLAPERWLQATVGDFSNSVPALVRSTRAAFLDDQCLEVFCQRLLQENTRSSYYVELEARSSSYGDRRPPYPSHQQEGAPGTGLGRAAGAFCCRAGYAVDLHRGCALLHPLGRPASELLLGARGMVSLNGWPSTPYHILTILPRYVPPVPPLGPATGVRLLRRSPVLQAWLFGVGLHYEAIKLTSVAKATTYKYHLGLQLDNASHHIDLNIIQLTRMNGHVLVGLVNKSLAERLINEGLEVEGMLLRTFPFCKRSVKITIGNLPFFVGDASVIDALSPYGRVTSIAPKQLKAGEYGYTDGRREAYIHLHDRINIERLSTRLGLGIKGETWPAFLTFGIRCSRCHNQGHRRANLLFLARQFTTERKHRWIFYTQGSAAPNNSLQVRRMSSVHRIHLA